MNHKRNASLIGVLFIIAAISAIIGLALYQPILQDEHYMVEGANHASQIILGAFFELILVASAVGTGITLFPYLKKYSETLALGYFTFRVLEAIFIMIGIVSVLSLLSLSQTYATSIPEHNASLTMMSVVLKAMHSWTFMLGPNFMLGVNTFIYSYVLLQSKLVPRVLAYLGIISAILIWLAAILEMFGIIDQLSTPGFLLAFPIFLFEMTFAVRLIWKGFNSGPTSNMN